MAKGLGSDAVLTVDDVGGGSATTVGGVTSVDFSFTVNAVDCTTNDSSGSKEYLPGDDDATASITFYAETDFGATPTDAGQDEIRDAVFAKTQKEFVWSPNGTATDTPKYTFNGYITDFSHGAAHEEVVEVTVSVQISGGVTAGVNT